MYRTLYCHTCHETRQMLIRRENRLYILCAKCGTIIKKITDEELLFESENELCGVYKIQLDSTQEKFKISNISENERERFSEEYAKIQKVSKEDYERILESSKKEYERILELNIEYHHNIKMLQKENLLKIEKMNRVNFKELKKDLEREQYLDLDL